MTRRAGQAGAPDAADPVGFPARPGPAARPATRPERRDDVLGGSLRFLAGVQERNRAVSRSARAETGIAL